jgi:hypothetical protein
MSSKLPLFPTAIDAKVHDLTVKQTYLASIAKRTGIAIPDAEITALAQLVLNVNAAYDKTTNPDTCTKLDFTARDEAIESAEFQFRRVIEFYIVGNPAATKVDYEALRIPEPGPHPHLPAPKFMPGIGHITSSNMIITVPFFDLQTGKRAKPPGVHAIEAYYQVGGIPPESVTQLSERAIDTASPLELKFSPDDVSKIVYLAFRWIGTRGDYGPWTIIYSINILR